MKLSDLKAIDVKTLGTATVSIKAAVVGALCIALASGGYYFDTQKQLEELKRVEATEGELRQAFEGKQKKAANLELYKAQLAQMRLNFGTMLRQLPSETEIPNLIEDISQTGLASGLEIDLFKPGPEARKDFYAEKPIQLKVHGDYHEFGKFASGVATLPRIVTLHNIILAPGKEGELMTMEATAKTYRYLEDGE